MSFSTNIAPYVQRELAAAEAEIKQGRMEAAFSHLESAHVLGQQSTKWHVLAHFRMLQWAIRKRDMRELFGQIFRIAGAATKTFVGLVPTGNTGGSNVSPFRAMPLSDAHRQTLASVKRKQSD